MNKSEQAQQQSRHPKGHPQAGKWKDENKLRPKAEAHSVPTVNLTADIGAATTPTPFWTPSKYGPQSEQEYIDQMIKDIDQSVRIDAIPNMVKKLYTTTDTKEKETGTEAAEKKCLDGLLKNWSELVGAIGWLAGSSEPTCKKLFRKSQLKEEDKAVFHHLRGDLDYAAEAAYRDTIWEQHQYQDDSSELSRYPEDNEDLWDSIVNSWQEDQQTVLDKVYYDHQQRPTMLIEEWEIDPSEDCAKTTLTMIIDTVEEPEKGAETSWFDIHRLSQISDTTSTNWNWDEKYSMNIRKSDRKNSAGHPCIEMTFTCSYPHKSALQGVQENYKGSEWNWIAKDVLREVKDSANEGEERKSMARGPL